MKIAKIEITDKLFLKKIKDSINRIHYVECGLCGAFRVEAIELARVIHSFIDRSKDASDEPNDSYSDLLTGITESPGEFESFEEYQKWEVSNDRPAYYFLDDDDFGNKKYGSYDEIVLFCDLTCNCFSKDKIKE